MSEGHNLTPWATRVIHSAGSCLEGTLSALLGCAFARKIHLLFVGNGIAERGKWIRVSWEKGSELRFSVGGIIGAQNFPHTLARLQLSQYLLTSHHSPAYIEEDRGPDEGALVSRFKVYSSEYVEEGVVSAWRNEQSWSREEGGDYRNPMLLGRSVQMKIYLTNLEDVGKKIASPELELYLESPGILSSWRGRGRRIGEYLSIQIMGEISMPSTPIRGTISLGSIELTLEDLFALRVGSSIEVDTPPEIFATIETGSICWARGVLAYDGGKARFMVRSLEGIPGVKENLSQLDGSVPESLSESA